jgi:hypothetical protein
VLQARIEEREPLGVEGRDVGGVVRCARVAEVAELQRDRRRLARLAQQVIDAQALADGEQVVGPAGLDEQRRHRLFERRNPGLVVHADGLQGDLVEFAREVDEAKGVRIRRGRCCGCPGHKGGGQRQTRPEQSHSGLRNTVLRL